MVTAAAVAALMAASGAGAREASPETIPKTVVEIVQLADAVAPEFGARALLDVATHSRLDPRTRRKYIRTAFDKAAAAQRSLPWSVRGETETLDAVLDRYASELGMDRLSLECAAVRAMLPLDIRAGHDLFLEVTPAPPREPGCTEAAFDQRSVWFATAAEVAAHLPRDEGTEVLSAALRRLAGPAELAGAMDALLKTRLPESEMDSLIVALVGGMEIAAPNRAVFLRTLDETAGSTQALLKRTRNAGLRRAWRLWAVRNLAAPTCSGDAQADERKALEKLTADLDLQPEEVKPARILSARPARDQPAAVRSLLDRITRVGYARPPEQHKLLEELEEAVEELKPGDDLSQAAVARQTTLLHGYLLGVAPTRAVFERLLPKYMRDLAATLRTDPVYGIALMDGVLALSSLGGWADAAPDSDGPGELMRAALLASGLPEAVLRVRLLELGAR